MSEHPEQTPVQRIANGLTEDEVKEAITHVAFYAGWPRAVSARRQARPCGLRPPTQRKTMNIEPTRPTSKNPPEQFAGDVWLDPIALPHENDQRMIVATVRFAPGARTAWHSHARGQYLRVTQGVARFGARDGTIIEVHPGQTLYTPPGEEHWHAAAPGCFMEHIAMLERRRPRRSTTAWAEHITDDEYEGR